MRRVHAKCSLRTSETESPRAVFSCIPVSWWPDTGSGTSPPARVTSVSWSAPIYRFREGYKHVIYNSCINHMPVLEATWYTSIEQFYFTVCSESRFIVFLKCSSTFEGSSESTFGDNWNGVTHIDNFIPYVVELMHSHELNFVRKASTIRHQ